MSHTTMTTNRCACGRDYFTEKVGENGKCCICNRDARMVARLGNDWRSILSRQREAQRRVGKQSVASREQTPCSYCDCRQYDDSEGHFRADDAPICGCGHSESGHLLQWSMEQTQ